MTLRPGRERSLVRRHPWVFSGAVQRVTGRPGSGATIRIESADGHFLGWGGYSPESQIVARVWTFDEDETVDEGYFTTRIAAAAARRTPLAVVTDACRLVFSESDGLPGLIADRYGATAVVELTTAGTEHWREAIGEALVALPGVESVYERSDVDSRKREGLPMRTGVLTGAEPPDEIVISEHGARYAVDVRLGHKTGFYLDQRDSRAAVQRLAGGRRVLNTFCYTGSFSVVAGLGGAAEVASVDSSGPALTLAAANLARNGLPPGELTEADVFSDLRRRRAAGERFGMIILDPPKLVARADRIDQATRAYKDLNLIACQLLEPGGLLVTFSCSGLLEEALFQKVVAGAALDARRDARIIGRLHQPADHPVHLAVPETAYLKGLICEVE